MSAGKDSWGSSTTLRGDIRPPTLTASGRYLLVVIRNGLSSTYALPDEGEVPIGRADTNRIRVDDRSISRNHAVLRLKGGEISIEDLGSSNGTRVRDRALAQGERALLSPGEVVDVGSTMFIVQARTTPSRARRIWAHDYFEARLEDECARAERSGTPFALVRVHVRQPAAADLVQHALSEILRQVDVLGRYAPAELEAILMDAGTEEVERFRERLVATLGERAGEVTVGAALWPRHGRNPDALVALASALARGEKLEARVERELTPSEPMARVLKLAERIAPGTLPVLILGETGSGKEVLAQRIHALSPRAQKPFLSLNCAALSETLLESELFGHERGAFTGAVAAKPGLLETAEGGTVFLDEVGELPMAIQVKLLRVIETRQVLRVGGLKTRPIDVRFLSATNRDLEGEVARGAFRQDLFFRLNGISLYVPPLRERVLEIRGLCESFLAQATRAAGRADAPAISPEAMTVLERYSWPGNIRELRNVIERAVLLCVGTVILPEHLPLEKMKATLTGTQVSVPDDPTPPTGRGGAVPVKSELHALERQRILDALKDCAGNQTKAAKLLGMSRRTFLNRLDAYGISRPRKPATSPPRGTRTDR
ncbi:MAG TPA: sigma 54-interacting transcriptional regulator [Haliangiales bacterium]|nr:sigma 54-interacting transcriptional regulator [Haliangiales bacterium]